MLLRRSLWLAPLVFGASAAQAADRLQPQPIETFNGQSWAGLTLGEDTDGSIKRAFQTEKGAVRPEALKFVNDRRDGVRVDALLDGRGGKAVLRAIRVQYDDQYPDLQKLSETLAERPLELWPRERTEDWRVLAFMQRGVIAVVAGSGARQYTPIVFLCDPKRMAASLEDYEERETPIGRPFDPGQDWDRVVRFGQIRWDFSYGKNKPEEFNGFWQRDLKNRIEDDITDSRRLRYDSRVGGSVTVNMSTGDFRDGEAEFRFNITMHAQTPYGSVTKFGNESRKISGNRRSRVHDLFRDAWRELEDEVVQAVRSFGPEPVSAARDRTLAVLMDALTGVRR
jgi:opacity protein-like surface antigen